MQQDNLTYFSTQFILLNLTRTSFFLNFSSTWWMKTPAIGLVTNFNPFQSISKGLVFLSFCICMCMNEVVETQMHFEQKKQVASKTEFDIYKTLEESINNHIFIYNINESNIRNLMNNK